MSSNQAKNQAYNSFAQQMMGLLSQKAQMENQKDSTRMQGEYNRDLADRQDIDQFYTNLVQNLSSQSELMQKTGRDLNTAQYNKDVLALSAMYSKYGIGVKRGANGRLVYTYNNQTIDEQKAMQIALEEEKKKQPQTTTTNQQGIVPAFSLDYGK
jgi:hypothetical protein